LDNPNGNIINIPAGYTLTDTNGAVAGFGAPSTFFIGTSLTFLFAVLIVVGWVENYTLLLNGQPLILLTNEKQQSVRNAGGALGGQVVAI
jgi:hypothetical protein